MATVATTDLSKVNYSDSDTVDITLYNIRRKCRYELFPGEVKTIFTIGKHWIIC